MLRLCGTGGRRWLLILPENEKKIMVGKRHERMPEELMEEQVRRRRSKAQASEGGGIGEPLKSQMASRRGWRICRGMQAVMMRRHSRPQE